MACRDILYTDKKIKGSSLHGSLRKPIWFKRMLFRPLHKAKDRLALNRNRVKWGSLNAGEQWAGYWRPKYSSNIDINSETVAAPEKLSARSVHRSWSNQKRDRNHWESSWWPHCAQFESGYSARRCLSLGFHLRLERTINGFSFDCELR